MQIARSQPQWAKCVKPHAHSLDGPAVATCEWELQPQAMCRPCSTLYKEIIPLVCQNAVQVDHVPIPAEDLSFS